MVNKIELLITFEQVYTAHISFGQSHETAIQNAQDYLVKKSADTILPEHIARSFIAQCPTAQDAKKWLKQELQEFEIFLADDKFQTIPIPYLHCMSFVYHFMKESTDTFFCDSFASIDARINEFVKDATKQTLENLNPGDIVVYKESNQFSHIAVYIGKINGYHYVISKFGLDHGVFIHPVNQVYNCYGEAEFYNNSTSLSQNAVEKIAEINKLIVNWNYTTHLSFDKFKEQYEQHLRNSLFFRHNNTKNIAELKNDHAALIVLYQKMIERVNEYILFYQNKLRVINLFGDDGDALKSRINSALAREQRYLNDLKSQLAIAQSLAPLFSLKTEQLFEEAKKNKASALLIFQTPKLLEQLSLAQMVLCTHQDSELVKTVATILASHEYSHENAKMYIDLKEQLTSDADKDFVTSKENEVIRKLLVNINNYLDDKINPNAKENKSSLSLGYFGSRHKVITADKSVSVPQGIYELKVHLALLDEVPSIEILTKIKTTLKSKQEEIHDESFIAQVKRFVSYILGYHRAQNTIEAYNHLDQVASGIQTS
jgi:hypothetical protein